MSCKWQREVERREKRETRLYTNTGDIIRDILSKYNCPALDELNTSLLTKTDKEKLRKALIKRGYNEKTLKMIYNL